MSVFGIVNGQMWRRQRMNVLIVLMLLVVCFTHGLETVPRMKKLGLSALQHHRFSQQGVSVDVSEDKTTSEVILSEGLGESPGITALEYLGRGYDIFYGNPHGSPLSPLDPGFRDTVVLLDQDQKSLTIDQMFLQPKNAHVFEARSCKADSRAVDISTMDDYSSTLEIEASIEASGSYGPMSGSFSLSVGYEQQSKKQQERASSTFQTKVVCTEFQGRLDMFSDLGSSISSSLFKALEKVKDNEDDEDLVREIIDTFGTHYVKNVVIGGKRIYSKEYSSARMMELEAMGIDVAAAVSFSYGQSQTDTDDCCQDLPEEAGFEVSASLGVKFSTEELQETTEGVEEVNEIVIGGRASDDWYDWAETIRENPMPIIYDLESIPDLLRRIGKQEMADLYHRISSRNVGLELSREKYKIEQLQFGILSCDGASVTGYSRSSSKYLRSQMMTYIEGSSMKVMWGADRFPYTPTLIANRVRSSIGSDYRDGALTSKSDFANFFPPTISQIDKTYSVLQFGEANYAQCPDCDPSWWDVLWKGRLYYDVLCKVCMKDENKGKELQSAAGNVYSFLAADHDPDAGVISGIIDENGFHVDDRYGMDDSYFFNVVSGGTNKNKFNLFVDTAKYGKVISVLAIPYSKKGLSTGLTFKYSAERHDSGARIVLPGHDSFGFAFVMFLDTFKQDGFISSCTNITIPDVNVEIHPVNELYHTWLKWGDKGYIDLPTVVCSPCSSSPSCIVEEINLEGALIVSESKYSCFTIVGPVLPKETDSSEDGVAD